MTGDRISDDELAFHLKALAAKKAADATWVSWGSHLASKYELSAEDGIAEDGRIHRAAHSD